ncbi:MAG: hypothetical protein LBF40_01455 [Deltaproteobacteria bacterium]|jgi:hypothetical protein|nr:hypothetical protein [Deltaproteobacteria bacterium]
MSDWKHQRFDRLWRLCALFVLCGLVYYFSFDNGRQTAKARIGRYEAEKVRMQSEIESLRVQLNLQEEEIRTLKSGEAEPPSVAEEDARAVLDASPQAVDGLAISAAGAGPREADLSIPQPAEGSDQEGSVDPKDVTRLSVRPGESRLILDDQVRLSVLEIDSIDKVAQVRVQHLDTDARHSRTMEAGDSLIITRGDERHILLLDQLKSSSLVFLLIKT